MYLFMCVLQWISIYEIHFGSRGYSFVITCNFLSTLHALNWCLHMRFPSQFLHGISCFHSDVTLS